MSGVKVLLAACTVSALGSDHRALWNGIGARGGGRKGQAGYADSM
jgi:hypothetical protein